MDVVTLHSSRVEFVDAAEVLRIQSPQEQSELRKLELLQSLLAFLKQHRPHCKVFGYFINGCFRLTAPSRCSTVVEVSVDFYDGTRPADGVPRLHFRLNVQEEENPLSHDVRTDDPEQVRQSLCTAFALDP